MAACGVGVWIGRGGRGGGCEHKRQCKTRTLKTELAAETDSDLLDFHLAAAPVSMRQMGGLRKS